MKLKKKIALIFGVTDQDGSYLSKLLLQHVINLDKKDYYKQTSLNCSHINIGSGKDLSIKELAEIIKEVVGYKSKINFYSTKPDGVKSKLLNCCRINNLGFKAQISLKEDLINT